MYAETTVIYSDVLFLINFSLDYLCLFITGRLMICGGKAWRLALGATLGGLYSFLPYIIELPIYISFPLHIVTAGIMCLISFGTQILKKTVLTILTFVVSSALMGGLITAIFNLTSHYSDGIYREFSDSAFFIVCVISALTAMLYGLISRKKIHTASAEIRFYISREQFSVRLLADSGNLVTEPFSALPVIVVSSSALPPPYDRPESDSFPLPIRIIPFSSSAGKSCFYGFRPDRIELVRLAKKPQKIDAYIGIDTANSSYSGYDGIIPTCLL